MIKSSRAFAFASIIGLSAVAVSSCTAQAATPAEQATATANLRVEGMHCASCSVTVDAAIEKLDGVREAKVSAKEKRARVTYDPARVTPQQMVQAIKDAGFDATIES